MRSLTRILKALSYSIISAIGLSSTHIKLNVVINKNNNTNYECAEIRRFRREMSNVINQYTA